MRGITHYRNYGKRNPRMARPQNDSARNVRLGFPAMTWTLSVVLTIS